jgi:hypothetical protein
VQFRSRLIAVGAESSAPIRSMPLAQVGRGARESRTWPGTRRPRASCGLIDSDFAFHVISAAYKLRKSHDHDPGHGITGITRTKRARRGPARRRERPKATTFANKVPNSRH